ncbi:hypothetical protein PTW35_19565 (plasmid) [Photobacterium sp. DA100]|uniref:hypothetical protein n=1 Tax=Photobacterium sp. DA100 TaxID=3027472 RepID=UPI00247907BB|nr:hypothetical protein [Photobacterium sp. DA100]WEM45287.1 hypothetical protein PTW35_19565 [Photobacterium sp. DA100]
MDKLYNKGESLRHHEITHSHSRFLCVNSHPGTNVSSTKKQKLMRQRQFEHAFGGIQLKSLIHRTKFDIGTPTLGDRAFLLQRDPHLVYTGLGMRL